MEVTIAEIQRSVSATILTQLGLSLNTKTTYYPLYELQFC